jgi:sugar phosphate isomerase/epimerase
MLSRRSFLGGLAATAAALPLAHAAAPFVRAGKSHLRLSLAAYSFRDDGAHGKDSFRGDMDMFKFIDFCAEHGCEGAELTSYYFPANVTDDYLARVHRHAHLRGVSVSGTAVGNNFCLPVGEARDKQLDHVKEWVRKATILGAPHIRVFAGTAPKDMAKEEAKKLCIAALEECGDVAGKAGIFLGIENHGGIVAEADDLVDILKAVKSPWIGINLDTGNFHTADPYADLAKIAPWAVNVQFKNYIQARGEKVKGPGDTARTFKILRDANYQGFVALEYELPEDPAVRVPQILTEMKKYMG